MHTIKTKLKDFLFTTGVAMIALSALIFLIPMWTGASEGTFGFFMVHFILTIAYGIILLSNSKNKIREHRRIYTLLFLVLFLISAYALNREMEVFAASPVWLCCLLVLLCINYIISIFFESLPSFFKYLIFFLLGIALTLFLYMSFYLVPLYLFSALAAIGLGISLHTFVPLLFCICTLLLAKSLAAGRRRYWNGLYSGVVAAITVVVFYTITWQANVKQVNQSYSRAISEGSDELPTWIQIAQKVKISAVSERILKTDLVYVVPNWNDSFLWNVPHRTFGEEQLIHDPLVVLANLFSPKIYLNDEDKLAILKSQFNGRLQTEERLWTGKNLSTQLVNTSVRIWPQYRLAYTEKVLTVANHAQPYNWDRGEEAIYNFQLPEGSVITSLSLWVNGKEAKGILTTKEKADSAYKTIVGVENRDPSVVHWLEGNKVSVRVFPVMAKGTRIFKIGITSPLKSENGNLSYENISFDGPDATKASEDVKITLDKPVTGGFNQTAFKVDENNMYTRSGHYQPQWSFDIKAEALSTEVFSFGGSQYGIKPLITQRANADISDVFLDINDAWTNDEFNAVWASVKNKNVWVYNNELVKLSEENKQSLFNQLSQLKFSLFPVYVIRHASNSLLVSKSGAPSPNLSDMEGSSFLKTIKKYAAEKQKIHFFNIGSTLTPYLASLKEYRFFLYEQGDTKTLQTLLNKQQFAIDVENENEIAINAAGISIYKKEDSIAGKAPDHLMRLFTYNHIMQQLGQAGISGLADNSALVDQAEKAYIVSPVSSLVVLETQADYDRFGIEENKNSLKNASLKSKGAVPEPHEWVLIFLVAAIAVYLFYKNRM